ncbi:MAG: acyl carrier protein [Olegusella sp.]|jgi:acyl carrier protein|nr:acyl carrier protein [Olegusella sp.]
MNREEILKKVKSLVAETLELDESDIQETTAYKDLGADSFDLLELVTAIEDEFGITMNEDSVASIETVGQTVDEIEKVQ